MNKLAAIFRGPLKNYVVKVIMDILANQSGWLLQSLNQILSPHWDLILKTAKVNLDDLEPADANSVIAAIQDPWADEIDLVWTEFVPLGINLVVNDKSGLVKVKDFPRGSQARQVANKYGIDPDGLCGATIKAVNGSNFDHTERAELIQALREPERPKTIKFKLVPGNQDAGLEHAQENDDEGVYNSLIPLKSIEIVDEGANLGIEFGTSVDNSALAVKEFLSEGLAKAADTENMINIGDILVAVNNNRLLEGNGPWIQKSYELLQSDGLSRPLRLDFATPYLEKIILNKDVYGLKSDGPHELLLKQKKIGSGASRVFLDGYRGVDGAAESSGVIIGDNLIFINGMPVGAGTKMRSDCPQLDMPAIQQILSDQKSYPICLHFARQASTGRKKVELDVESDEMKTFAVVASSQAQLGCSIAKIGVQPVKFVVHKFNAVPGYFKTMIAATIRAHDIKELAFYSINGEVLPSYVSCDMVMSAMKRGWKSGHLEIVFCNEKIKHQLTKVSS